MTYVPSTSVDKSKTFVTTNTLSATMVAATTVKICEANPKRKSFSVYNNSTNTLYVGVDVDASGGNQIGQCATNAGPTAHFYSGMMGSVCYTGALYGRRNSGTGNVVVIEFE